jgi:thiol:disulfide interchange protein
MKPFPSWPRGRAASRKKPNRLPLSFMTDDETLAALKTARDMYFYAEDWGLITYATPQTIVVDGDKLNITLQRDTRPLSEFASIKGIFTYATADMPEGTHPSAVYIDVPLMEVAQNSASAGHVATDMIASLNTDDVSFMQAMFLAFLGGIILNLMPCVFPVLSMKALSLVKMSEREQRHAATHGLLYTAGILLCFLAIAGLMIALQVAGSKIGWGFQLQNPVVVLLLAYLLFVMGMNMSGFFEFRGSFLANIGHKLASHHGYTGTFFTGMLATLVATPCTAPFMATAMGYALTQPAAVALSVFAALGLGLAAPYLALCFIPPLRKSLPRPGAWMETFRQFMAFPLYASVAWLVWVYAQQASGSYAVLLALIGLICLALAVWIGRHTPTRQPMKLALRGFAIFATFIALLIAACSGMLPQTQATQAGNIGMDYTPFSNDALNKAMDGNDPIFIDMTAAWCITCKVNEKLALDTKETRTLFKQKNVRVMVGDWTNQNPEITEFLQSYGRSGVPLYVYIGPRDMNSGKRPDAVVLPQLLTSSVIAEAINGENTTNEQP